MAAPARSGISRFDGNQDADRLAPPESEAEDWIFAGSALIFVEPTKSERAHQALRQALGGKRLEAMAIKGERWRVKRAEERRVAAARAAKQRST
jgi:hypothetical protein